MKYRFQKDSTARAARDWLEKEDIPYSVRVLSDTHYQFSIRCLDGLERGVKTSAHSGEYRSIANTLAKLKRVIRQHVRPTLQRRHGGGSP